MKTKDFVIGIALGAVVIIAAMAIFNVKLPTVGQAYLTATEVDMDDFPDFFIFGNILRADIVVGHSAPAEDVISAVDVIAGIQHENAIEVDPAKLDNEDLQYDNLILIGLPSRYSADSNVLIDRYDLPELDPGQGLIALFEDNGYYHVVVTGRKTLDVRKAARVLGHYYEYNLEGNYICVTGDSLTNPTVRNEMCESSGVPDCVEEGEVGNYFENEECCNGLQDKANAIYSESGCAVVTDGSFICINCLDGICGDGENFCNCPEDCPVEEEEEEEEESEEEKEEEIICDGCLMRKACIPYGIRIEGQFCDLDGSFKVQKEAENSCDNDYECKTNLCINSECVSGTFWNKIMNFFGNIFGG